MSEITTREAMRPDGTPFRNFLTYDVLEDGKVIGQIQSKLPSGGEMAYSRRAVEHGGWVAWAGEAPARHVDDSRLYRVHDSKAKAIGWIETEMSDG